MRIAQVAPPFESVPPAGYGGTERIVHHLTEDLVALGHEVTLFASGDSRTSAELVPICERGLRLDDGCQDPLAHVVIATELVARHAHRFDVIHCHCDYFHFPLLRRQGTPYLTTAHGRQDIPDLVPLHRTFPGVAMVSISDAQRRPLPWVNWIGTVYHGLPPDLLRLREGPGDYLAFLGRISPEKGPDRAIRIARRVGLPLRIAAKIDRSERGYFRERIAPLLRGGDVELVGEIGEEGKEEFLGGARALLFPIDWPEPFGLVLIEAMACGTPVVAYPAGAVPEVLEQGLSGFLARSEEDAAAAVERAGALDRRGCRAAFERRFTARRMSEEYLQLYERLRAQPAEPSGRGKAAR